MADFKTHLSFGAATGFGLSVFTYMVDWISNLYMAVIIFFSTLIGAFLPDMDSSSGLPVKIIFGFYAYLSATLSLYFTEDAGLSIYFLIFLPAASFVFVKVFLEKIFIKYTTHRGIFHSIPATLITFLLALIIANQTKLPLMEKFVIALSLGLGYFCHLLLDELFSFNIITTMLDENRKETFTFKKFFKNKFGVKKSFRTALDLGFNQDEKYPGIIAYVILIVLIVFAFPVLKQIFLIIK